MKVSWAQVTWCTRGISTHCHMHKNLLEWNTEKENMPMFPWNNLQWTLYFICLIPNNETSSNYVLLITQIKWSILCKTGLIKPQSLPTLPCLQLWTSKNVLASYKIYSHVYNLAPHKLSYAELQRIEKLNAYLVWTPWFLNNLFSIIFVI
jgi:hypothetical protein